MDTIKYENWRESFKDKEITPEKLKDIIKPGSNIYIGSGCSEPIILTNQLIKYANTEFLDCQIYHFFSVSNQKFFDEKNPTRFRHNTLSIIYSEKMRQAINTGKADYTPIRSAEIPYLLQSHVYNIDYALLQVSPPDKNGWLSLGINVDINRAIVQNAKVIICQINPSMPKTMGDSYIKIDDIDYFVYHEAPLLEVDKPNIDDKTEEICRYISRLIDDGSTLNLGLGRIPYYLPKFLEDKKDLAIYSEIFIESLIPLIEKDVINCKRNVFPYCITSFSLGSKKLYDFLDQNPFIKFFPTDFVTNINNISQNNKMTSVYSALTVDLIGQVTNDMKSQLFRGIGGESDFMRGTTLSKGGKCIIALPSITENGRSRIIPLLTTEPTAVPSFDVHYVVTEYGIAYLYGKSLRERILQMIGVAHPKYRKWLLESAKKYLFIYEDQKLPQTHDGTVIIYPDIEWTFREFHLNNINHKIKVRPVKPTDERMLQELYYGLSEEDRIMRFFRPLEFFPHEETQNQVICDYHKSMVLVAVLEDDTGAQRIIGVGGYFEGYDTNYADISFTIHKDFRKMGLGKFLAKKLIELARQKGYKGICGDVLFENKAMIGLLNSLDWDVDFHPEEGSLHFIIDFEKNKEHK
ncbi:MAG: GNAT family N-acetyltransferase [Promethearchaeota archaeon]